MQVKIVSVTASLIEERIMTAEELIVYTARVSNPGNQLNVETSDRLIDYLVKNKHWSPFEMADMTVEIVTSRAIAAQILRHRSFSFQEFSQRYAEVTEIEPVQLRKQAEKNRQSSAEAFDPKINVETAEGKEQMTASEAIELYLKNGERLYQALLALGVAKECARMVLPLTTQTKIYMKGSVRSWIHYLQIRCDGHTQLEHREIALAIRKIFATQFPSITKALSL